MREEEIIEMLSDLLEDKITIEQIRTMSLLNEDDEMPYTLTIFERNALEKLLDLYQKEKEKNKKVNEINFRVNKNLLETAEKLEQEKEKNKELELELNTSGQMLTKANTYLENISRELGLTDKKTYGYVYTDVFNKIKSLKEKNKKTINMLKEHIKHCEKEAKGSLNNEICHISLKFDNHLLQVLEEE